MNNLSEEKIIGVYLYDMVSKNDTNWFCTSINTNLIKEDIKMPELLTREKIKKYITFFYKYTIGFFLTKQEKDNSFLISLWLFVPDICICKTSINWVTKSSRFEGVHSVYEFNPKLPNYNNKIKLWEYISSLRKRDEFERTGST